MSNQNQNKTDEREGLPSASGAHRWNKDACPGSHLAEQSAKEAPAGENTTDRDFGTRMHKIMAGEEHPLNLEETRLAAAAHENNSTILIRCNAESEVETEDIWRERRIWIVDNAQASSPLRFASAKLDVAFIFDGEAVVIDYSFGRKGKPSAEVNWQLLVQAVALHEAYPGLERIYAAINAPMLPKAEQIGTIACYEASDLELARRQVIEDAQAAMTPNQPRHVGYWCEYCKAASTCPEKRKELERGALQLANRPTTYDLAQPPTGKQGAEELAFYADLRKALKQQGEPREQQAKDALALDPGCIPGWGLDKGKELTECTDIEAAYQAFSDEVTQKDFLSCIKGLSIPALAKVLALKANISELAARKLIEGKLGSLLMKKTSEPSLRREKA